MGPPELVAIVAAESRRTGAAMNCWSRNWPAPHKLRRPACCCCRETRTDNLINKETRASVCRHKLPAPDRKIDRLLVDSIRRAYRGTCLSRHWRCNSDWSWQDRRLSLYPWKAVAWRSQAASGLLRGRLGNL